MDFFVCDTKFDGNLYIFTNSFELNFFHLSISETTAKLRMCEHLDVCMKQINNITIWLLHKICPYNHYTPVKWQIIAMNDIGHTHTHTHDTSRIHYWEQYYICCKYISSCLSLIIINYTPIVIIDIARVSSGRVLSFSPTTRNVCDFSFLYVSLYFSYILFLAWTSRSHLFFAVLSFPFKILWTSPYLICFFFFGFPYAHCPVFLFFFTHYWHQ